MNIKGVGLFGSIARAGAPAQKASLSRVKNYAQARPQQVASPKRQAAPTDKVSISKEGKQAQAAANTKKPPAPADSIKKKAAGRFERAAGQPQRQSGPKQGGSGGINISFSKGGSLGFGTKG